MLPSSQSGPPGIRQFRDGLLPALVTVPPSSDCSSEPDAASPSSWIAPEFQVPLPLSSDLQGVHACTSVALRSRRYPPGTATSRRGG
eukprot:6981732-Alexandrium_andersonii.AAC.1